MNDPRWIILLATFVGGAGIWLLLPRGTGRGRGFGVVLAAAGLGLLGSQVPPLREWMSQSIFAMLAAVTVVSAGAAMTLRTPVYCAIWFGLSLVGTAGLFLIQGAQFLAVATIVVYAGAILVTFLFLLMLAEPSGRARYDRTSWEGMLSAFSGAVLVGLLTMTVTGVLGRDRGPLPPTRVTGQERQQGVLAEEHVRRIGEELFGHEALFGRYLVAVEAAGALLLAALVGAAVIVGRARGPLAASEAAPLPRPDSGEDAHGRG